MKNTTLNILMLILLLTVASAGPLHAALVNAHWSVPADNEGGGLSGDPNEPAPEPEFIKCLSDSTSGDPNEPEPESE